MLDRVAAALELVKTELQHSAAKVTVTLIASSAPLQPQQQTQPPTQTQLCRSSSQASQHPVSVRLLSDNYHDVMSQTARQVESELQQSRQLLGQCKESFSSLVSFFGENAQALTSDTAFWSDIVVFVEKLTACQRQLRKQMQVRHCSCDHKNDGHKLLTEAAQLWARSTSASYSYEHIVWTFCIPWC